MMSFNILSVMQSIDVVKRNSMQTIFKKSSLNRCLVSFERIVVFARVKSKPMLLEITTSTKFSSEYLWMAIFVS